MGIHDWTTKPYKDPNRYPTAFIFFTFSSPIIVLNSLLFFCSYFFEVPLEFVVFLLFSFCTIFLAVTNLDGDKNANSVVFLFLIIMLLGFFGYIFFIDFICCSFLFLIEFMYISAIIIFIRNDLKKKKSYNFYQK